MTPEEAAEAHDLAALQLQGPTAKTNFHISKCAACRKPPTQVQVQSSECARVWFLRRFSSDSAHGWNLRRPHE